MRDSLGDRIKHNYENRSKIFLTRRMPVILRLDGKAFHTFTRGCQKPFDDNLSNCMIETSKKLLNEIQGAKLIYTQSDEISILLTDYDKLTTDAWFDYSVQKMCSIASAIASVNFTHNYWRAIQGDTSLKPAYFDCRAFNLPKEEVANYFLWRFNDWVRNSVAMVAQSLYSQKQLHGKNQSEQHELIFQKGQNWNDYEPKWKNGSFIYNRRDTNETVVMHHNIKELDFRNEFIDMFLNTKEK